MPTYAYACTACNHRFEVVQSFTDDSLTVCPECGGRLRKIFNAVGVVFKGNGFYRTDSRKEPARAGSSAASKDSAKNSGKDSGKGSSKESDSSSPSSGSTPSPPSTSRSSSTGAKGPSAPAATASTPAS